MRRKCAMADFIDRSGNLPSSKVIERSNAIMMKKARPDRILGILKDIHSVFRVLYYSFMKVLMSTTTCAI